MLNINYLCDLSHYVSGARIGASLSPEKVFMQKIKVWKSKSSIFDSPSARTFSIAGAPGVGKTCLLRYLANKYKGVYIDLKERKNLSKFPTHVPYIKQIETQINKSSLSRGRHLLLLDHVPVILDNYLKRLEEQVLLPELHRGSLLIMALQHIESWCWTQIDHPDTYQLRGFSSKDLPKFLGKNTSCILTEQVQEISPGIVQLCGKGEISINQIEQFIRYWLEEVEEDISMTSFEFENEIKLAGALAFIDYLDDWEIMEKIQRISEIMGNRNFNSINILSKYVTRQWLNKKYFWEPSIQHLFQVYFKKRWPDLYQDIQTVLSHPGG